VLERGAYTSTFRYTISVKELPCFSISFYFL
jgi:hypothetical protein